MECIYCKQEVKLVECLVCDYCTGHVHSKCLKRRGTPGDLAGDVFFSFKCSNCSPDSLEYFTRQKLPWVIILVLAIYNLSIKSSGLSHNGYFHWRTHIAYFIEKNWTYLFPSQIKRKKKWIGTIAGTLSLNNPEYFYSGLEILGEQGWWKLTHNWTPKLYQLKHEKTIEKKHHKNEKKERPVESDSEPEQAHSSASLPKKVKVEEPEEKDVFSRAIPYMGRKPWQGTTTSTFDDTASSGGNLTETNLSEFLPDLPTDNHGNLDGLPNAADDMIAPFKSENGLSILPGNDSFDMWNTTSDWNNSNNLSSLDVLNFDDQQHRNEDSDSYSIDDEIACAPRIVQVTNFQETDDEDNTDSMIDITNIKTEHDSELEEEEEAVQLCEPSLFRVTPKRDYPWLEDANHMSNETYNENMETMTEFEEHNLYMKLHNIIKNSLNNFEVPSWIRRFYRKLCVRKLKRSMVHEKLFDIDYALINDKRSGDNILDRYQHLITNNRSQLNENSTFHARLAGTTQYELFESPHTRRILHPFIYRNTKCIPEWVKIMCELQFKVNGELPNRASIDFCYVRPQHIPAINSLLQKMFWSGIDMSECLGYPDFSVVVLYKKLVVGCAFLVPDVGHNEAYISFLAVRPGWQRAGIAKFMLYHLTQTCMGKDITLHVSATNPAICLYQKFGFKIEEVALDFYDKYFPVETNHSTHAFFLRLSR